MLDKKLQLKDRQKIAIIGDAPRLQLESERSDTENAEAVIIFVKNEAELAGYLSGLAAAAKQNKLTWLAYPKANQLATDLNRDILRNIANSNGLDPVRQVAIDEVWSALRLKAI
jgi:hypothetical protein